MGNADVGAVEAVGEPHLGQVGVRPLPRGLQVLTQPDDAQHPAAGGHQLTVSKPRTGLDGPGVTDVGGQLNRPSQYGRTGIAAGGLDHHNGGPVTPREGRQLSEFTAGCSQQHGGERCREEGQDRLGLGVAETSVELHDWSGPAPRTAGR